MNKSLSVLFASIVILATHGFAVAQDEPRVPQQDTQSEGDPDAGKPSVPDDSLRKKEQDYLNALTECESLSGSQKESCIDAAKKKFGHE